jgi:phospholipid-translocating ATPase
MQTGRSEDGQTDELPRKSQRLRWATHRAAGAKGDKKRQSLIARAHKRIGSIEKKRNSANRESHASTLDTDPELAKHEAAGEVEEEKEDNGRTVYFNLPLPPDAVDENGHPLKHYARNKIRTAKYTPISFVPKNLWFQFHNIANVYFLFIVILGVSTRSLHLFCTCNSIIFVAMGLLVASSRDVAVLEMSGRPRPDGCGKGLRTNI